jgi:hypothetical protein
MRRGILGLLIVLGGLVSAFADADRQLAALDWLAGTWHGTAGRGEWLARYSTPEGGLILSLNKQIVDGRVVAFEFEQFQVVDGRLVMAPYPGGTKSPVVFTLTELDEEAQRAVFEKPEHDFPQIITYHRHAPGRLRILVQARRDGELQGFAVNLERQD